MGKKTKNTIKLYNFKKNIQYIVDIYKYINIKLTPLSSNKYIAGIALIIMNIGSKYVSLKFSKSTESFFKYIITKQLFIFTISWVATKDIFSSLVITAVFMTLTNHLFNEESKYCIISSDNFKHIYDVIDTNNDGKISDEELKNAIKILQKAKK
jgi:hypothetical protein